MSDNGEVEEDTRHKFDPIERQDTQPDISIPDDHVITVLETTCTFPSDIFCQIMYNLIKNPNITSSHLFRADIFYDSGEYTDLSLEPTKQALQTHLKPEYRPINLPLPGFNLTRTIVRTLIPRNPQLDAPLIQTCHIYHDPLSPRTLTLYIPHTTSPTSIPFYHPTASKVLFLHTPSHLSISYTLFPSTLLTPKLTRTALHLLSTIHKHGQGQLSGYTKRVHHDRVIPQKRYQDTYARLKGKYGRRIAAEWREVTDAGKHVFEDIGIAAFLIEVWGEWYGGGEGEEGKESRRVFPGFVDVGCGNGLLVHLLVEEGWRGWGFDARGRRSWEGFKGGLEERVLVPGVLCGDGEGEKWHDGDFRGDGYGEEEGPFIISNHADELTLWAPLLAYLNQSSFIAIPCCSHDLSGSRFRAPSTTKAGKKAAKDEKVPTNGITEENGKRLGAAESGSLLSLRPKPTSTNNIGKNNKTKMPSAYASLCSYLSALTAEVGYTPETEVLRIPSTRNMSVIGRYQPTNETDEERKKKVTDMIERELGKSIQTVGEEWIARAEKLSLKPGSGH